MANEIQIVEPDIKDLQTTSGDMVAHAEMLEVSDDATFAQGGEMLLELKRIAKTVEDRFAEPVSLAFKAHRSMTALRDSVLGPFKQAETIIKRKIGNYQTEIERKRQQEAERLRKEAEAKAEAERIAKAEAQMDKGDLKGCEQTLNSPAVPVTIRVDTPPPPKVAGISFRDVPKFEIEDANAVPHEFCSPDEKKIRSRVSAMGGRTNIPGIRIWIEKVPYSGPGRAA